MNTGSAIYRIVLMLFIALILLGFLIYGYIQAMADLIQCRETSSRQMEELNQAIFDRNKLMEENQGLRQQIESLWQQVQSLLQQVEIRDQQINTLVLENRKLLGRVRAYRNVSEINKLNSTGFDTDWRSWMVVGLLTCGAGSIAVVRLTRNIRRSRCDQSTQIMKSRRTDYPVSTDEDHIWICMTRDQASSYVHWLRKSQQEELYKQYLEQGPSLNRS